MSPSVPRIRASCSILIALRRCTTERRYSRRRWSDHASTEDGLSINNLAKFGRQQLPALECQHAEPLSMVGVAFHVVEGVGLRIGQRSGIHAVTHPVEGRDAMHVELVQVAVDVVRARLDRLKVQHPGLIAM